MLTKYDSRLACILIGSTFLTGGHVRSVLMDLSRSKHLGKIMCRKVHHTIVARRRNVDYITHLQRLILNVLDDENSYSYFQRPFSTRSGFDFVVHDLRHAFRSVCPYLI